MRNLKNLNKRRSIEEEKLVFQENWFDKIDTIIFCLFFLWGAILPFLIYFDPYKSDNGSGYYIPFAFTIFSVFAICKKLREKNFHKIVTRNSEEKNAEIIRDYCLKDGYETRRNSNGLIIYNIPNSMSINSSHEISRIFIVKENKIYFTMIKENHKLNIPVLFSDYFVVKDLKKLTK